MVGIIVDRIFMFLDRIWPHLVAVFITLCIARLRLPHISICKEKREGGTVIPLRLNTGDYTVVFASRFIVKNNSMSTPFRWLIPREVASNVNAKIEVTGLPPIERHFIMAARWASSPQIPFVGKDSRLERIYYPDPINIRSGSHEILDFVVHFHDDDIAYGWNNESYTDLVFRPPQYSLQPGLYCVRVTVTPQNGKEVQKEFTLDVRKECDETGLL